MVEISQLRQEWEAARNGGKGGNNEPILEHEIDVVGDDSDNEDQDERPWPKREEFTLVNASDNICRVQYTLL